VTVLPQCLRCKHFQPPPRTGPAPYACAAFPAGIPREILLAEHDHRRPFPGDHGIRFEPRDDPK